MPVYVHGGPRVQVRGIARGKYAFLSPCQGYVARVRAFVACRLPRVDDTRVVRAAYHVPRAQVYPRWVKDSEVYNEWMNPADYEADPPPLQPVMAQPAAAAAAPAPAAAASTPPPAAASTPPPVPMQQPQQQQQQVLQPPGLPGQQPQAQLAAAQQQMQQQVPLPQAAAPGLPGMPGQPGLQQQGLQQAGVGQGMAGVALPGAAAWRPQAAPG